MDKKRGDLQGLRGVAIIYVLMFHLKPSMFRLGFVGVDMFFVLSGFLMTMILRKEKKITKFVIGNFYLRRFKRIVPLYTLILLGTYLGLYNILLVFDRKQVVKDIWWSLSFTSNVHPIFEEEDYWQQISSYRFFVHTWSLGVEIQYYLLVPLVTFATHPCRPSVRVMMYVSIATCSLFSQLLASPKIAYGVLTSRVWQFLVGAIACEFSHVNLSASDDNKILVSKFINNTKSTMKDTKYEPFYSLLIHVIGLCVITISIVYDPHVIDETTARVFATILTGILVFLKHEKSPLNYPALIYIGDVSYVLYLVHWPIIVTMKYVLDTKELSIYYIIICVFIIMLLSVAIHNSVEQYFITNTISSAIWCWLFCVIVIISSTGWYTKEVSVNNFKNLSREEVITWNMEETRKGSVQLPCDSDTETPQWTGIENEEPLLRCQKNGTGKMNILIVGNSIAYRAFTPVNEILDGRFGHLRLYAKSGCYPLGNLCPDMTEASKIVMKKEKPDVLMHMHVARRSWEFVNFTDTQSDELFQTMKKNLMFFSENAKTVVIDLPYPIWEFLRPNMEKPGVLLAKCLKNNETIGDELTFTAQQDNAVYSSYKRRIEALKPFCENCIWNDIPSILYDSDGNFYLYDRKTKMSVIADGTHLTPVGLEMVKDSYRKILEPLIKKYN